MRATPVESAVAVGRRLGLVVERPIVLKEGLNLIVHLAPSRVVARVALRTAAVRELEPLADSLALAQYLVGRGLPVGPPADEIDAGPHVGPGGWRMTLWRHVEVLDRAPDPAAFGHSLRSIHEAAAAWDGPLRHVGPVEEIGRLLSHAGPRWPDEAALVDRGAAELELPDLPVQALHGDAHLGNVVVTPRGTLWMDWEECWRGPIAWDLACLEHRRRVMGELSDEIGTALAAYGPYDREAVDAYGIVMTLWAAAWGLLIAADTGTVGEGTRARLAWLAERFGSDGRRPAVG